MNLIRPTIEHARAAVADFHQLLARAHRGDRVAGEAARLLFESHPLYVKAIIPGAEAIRELDLDAFARMLTRPELCWLAPRGAGKSTDEVAFAVWAAIADPANHCRELRELGGLFSDAPHRVDPTNVRVTILSAGDSHAGRLLYQMKALLAGDVVRTLYGAPLVGARWSMNAADTLLRSNAGGSRDASFQTAGWESRVEGTRADLLLLDDVVSTELATPAAHEKMKERLAMSLRGAVMPWGRRLAVGTKYAATDLYTLYAEQSAQGIAWNDVWRVPALTCTADPLLTPDFSDPESLTSYWPELFPVEKLLAIRAEIGPMAFAQQYQNETLDPEGSVFTAELLRRATVEWKPSKPSAVRYAIAVDLAVLTDTKHDCTGIVVVAKHFGEVPYRTYIVESRRGRWGRTEVRKQLAELALKYPEVRVLCFERAPNVLLEVDEHARWARQRLAERFRTRVLTGNPQLYPKQARANALLAALDSDTWRIVQPTRENGNGRLNDELRMYPNGRGPGVDDVLDAAAWAAGYAARYITR